MLVPCDHGHKTRAANCLISWATRSILLSGMCCVLGVAYWARTSPLETPPIRGDRRPHKANTICLFPVQCISMLPRWAPLVAGTAFSATLECRLIVVLCDLRCTHSLFRRPEDRVQKPIILIKASRRLRDIPYRFLQSKRSALAWRQAITARFFWGQLKGQAHGRHTDRGTTMITSPTYSHWHGPLLTTQALRDTAHEHDV
jgi:hypothetical protein